MYRSARRRGRRGKVDHRAAPGSDSAPADQVPLYGRQRRQRQPSAADHPADPPAAAGRKPASRRPTARWALGRRAARSDAGRPASKGDPGAPHRGDKGRISLGQPARRRVVPPDARVVLSGPGVHRLVRPALFCRLLRASHRAPGGAAERHEPDSRLRLEVRLPQTRRRDLSGRAGGAVVRSQAGGHGGGH